jgi:hypothetical protein
MSPSLPKASRLPMRRPPALPYALLCLALSLLIPAPLPASAQPQRPMPTRSADEYMAKAAFIYNIALFVTLPNTNGMVRLCVLGRDPFGGALDALDGKALGNARLSIGHPRSGSEALLQCHILFIGASEADDLPLLAENAKAAGVLTIADTRGAARKGVMLELTIDERRIAFEFNGTAARSAGIALSSKVLRLARAVH